MLNKKSYPSGNHDLLFSELGLSFDAEILDVGGGSNPFKYADVVVDMDYSSGNIHRDGSALNTKKNRVTYIQADIHSLPFKDKAFDFVICMQVLEHVDSPGKACDELMRVSKAGFLETPRKWTEYYAGHPTHKWLVDYVGEDITFEPIKYNESPFLNFALPPLWNSTELQEKLFETYSNIPCLQVRWDTNGFKYKVLENLPDFVKDKKFLAESHYFFAKNILFWIGRFDIGAFHAETAFNMFPEVEKYQKLYLFYRVLTIRLKDVIPKIIKERYIVKKKDSTILILPNKVELKLIFSALLCRAFGFITNYISTIFCKLIYIAGFNG